MKKGWSNIEAFTVLLNTYAHAKTHAKTHPHAKAHAHALKKLT